MEIILSANDDTSVREEIANITNIVSTGLPILEAIFQNNLETLIVTSNMSQSIIDWDFPAQMESLGINLVENFSLQAVLLQTLIDWDVPAKIDELNINTAEAFATQDVLFQTKMDSLNTSLAESFASQTILLQAIFDEVKSDLGVYFNTQKDILSSIMGTTESIENFFKLTIGAEFFNITKESIKNLYDFFNTAVTKECFIDSKQAIVDLKNLFDSIFKGVSQSDADYFKNNDPTYDKRMEEIAKEANRLATIGNGLAIASLAIDAAALAVAITALALDILGRTKIAILIGLLMIVTAMTAFDPISKGIAGSIAAGGTAIAALPLATGGFPSMGQMFIAREAGPELVGTIGSRNAVVNNDQIVESVSRGVYDAMMASMGGQGGNHTFVLQLDGETVARKVFTLHNQQVMQTGVSPLLV